MLNILEVVKVQLHLLTNDKKTGAKALSYRNVKKLQDYISFEAESQRLWVLFNSQINLPTGKIFPILVCNKHIFHLLSLTRVTFLWDVKQISLGHKKRKVSEAKGVKMPHFRLI